MVSTIKTLAQKLPPGFSLCFQKTSLGMVIELKHESSDLTCKSIITDDKIIQLSEDVSVALTEAIINNQVDKIRNHKSYTKKPRA